MYLTLIDIFIHKRNFCNSIGLKHLCTTNNTNNDNANTTITTTTTISSNFNNITIKTISSSTTTTTTTIYSTTTTLTSRDRQLHTKNPQTYKILTIWLRKHTNYPYIWALLGPI